MKKIFALYSMVLLLQTCFADIPLDKNGNNETTFSDFNYLPFALGITFAVGILAFIYTLKKERNAHK